MHRIRHRDQSGSFQGHSSRTYDLIARSLARGIYRGLAADIARTAPQGAAVLDVGTGPGVLLLELGRRRSDLALTGVDLSPDMITAAEKNLRSFGDRATARTADVAALPFPDESFDLIVSSLSLHHWADPRAGAVDLARVLRPGGRLEIYDFRHAPFDELAAAAASTGRFAGQEPQRELVRTRMPLFPRLVRFILETPSCESPR